MDQTQAQGSDSIAEGYSSKGEGYYSIAIGHITELEKLQCPVCNPEGWKAFEELP